MALFKRKKSAETEKGAPKTDKEKTAKPQAMVKDAQKAKTDSGTFVPKKASGDKDGVKNAQTTKKPSMKELYGAGQAKTGAKKAEIAAKGKAPRVYGDAHKVIVKPLVTEKAANLSSENKYVFAVDPKANKIQITKAISEVYGIEPTRVRIISVKGKKVRYGRTIGQRKNWKKAIITLPAGKTIKVYEGV